MDGGTIAMHGMSAGLKKAGVEVEVLALNTKKHHVDVSQLPEEYIQDFKLTAIDVDTSVRILPAIMNLVGKGSYNIDRFDIPEVHERIRERLKSNEYDVIHLESLFMAPYIQTVRECCRSMISLRCHNVEYRIWDRMARKQNNPLKRWYFSFLSERIKEYEKSALSLIDGMVCISDEDADHFKEMGYSGPVDVISIGLDPDSYKVTGGSTDDVSFFHLASMDWMPNLQGVDWYLEKVHPLVCKLNSDVQVHFAGRSMPERIKKQASPQLQVYDRVDDAAGFMRDKQVMIVPLLSGSGVRVKIIEGLAMGKTIISTSVGAEGIYCTDGENIIIADSPEKFSESMLKCINDPAFCHNIGLNGRKLFENKYSDIVLGKRTVEFYRKLTVR
jgi:glycosyltransferase involved in cell wall biosynthesis